MNHINEFLNSKINDPLFSQKLLNAFIEARSKELDSSVNDIHFNGDPEAKKEIVSQSLLSMSYIQDNSTNNLVTHLELVDKYWDNKAVVYRGSRLPEPTTSFQHPVIHTTPQLNIAMAYADGTTNSSTGIGKILNPSNIGFITSFEPSLSTKTYSNFQYEDFKAGKKEDSITTLNDLKNDISHLSNIEQEDFNSHNDEASSSLKFWYDTAHNKKYYETLIPQESEVKSLYLKHNSGLLKLNKSNPEINQLLARTQEAVLRDFYEVQPLKKLQELLSQTPQNSENQNIIEKTNLLIDKLLNNIYEKPFTAKNTQDVSLRNENFLEKNPHIKKSQYIGSSMDQKLVKYPSIIENIQSIVHEIKFGSLELASAKLSPLQRHSDILDKMETFNQAFQKTNELSKVTLTM